MQHIAIMGTGMVGGALNRYFTSVKIEAGLYDPPKGLHDASLLEKAAIIFIAVPTPYYVDGSGFDDSFLRAAIEAIPIAGKIIVLKSTILPGTTEKFQEIYPAHRFLFNPEFLTEATVDFDMQYPKRQIIGTTKQSMQDAEAVLAILPSAPFSRIVDSKTAEFVKYFGNAFYALKVTYANQMYDMCEKLHIPYNEVQICAGAEPMIGPTHLEIFHKGYRGYGGKCLPKDTRSIIQLGEKMGIDLGVLKTAEKYNNILCSEQGLNIEWHEGSPKK